MTTLLNIHVVIRVIFSAIHFMKNTDTFGQKFAHLVLH